MRWRYPTQSWRFVSLGRLAPPYEPSFAPFASQVIGLPGEVAFVQSLITVSARRWGHDTKVLPASGSNVAGSNVRLPPVWFKKAADQGDAQAKQNLSVWGRRDDGSFPYLGSPCSPCRTMDRLIDAG